MKKQLLFIVLASLISTNVNAQNWDEVIKVVASDRTAGARLGASVSISGERAIVGAFKDSEDTTAGNTLNTAGSAYIFELVDGTWEQTAKLVASDREENDWFGWSVSISGDKAVVGAFQEDHDAAGGSTRPSAGSAYVFELIGGTWTETAKLVASDRDAYDDFGTSVGISGDKLIVGARGEEYDTSGANMLQNCGAAYIFEFDGTWSETIKLVASDRQASDYFGGSVSISGDKVVVGAHGEDHDANGGITYSEAGSAYVFELNGTWSQTAKIAASDRSPEDNFGYSVSISGDKLIVGAYLEDHDTTGASTSTDAGSAYIFEFDGAWTETAKLVASDRSIDDNFGISVCISGDKAIVGAYQENHDENGENGISNAGSAYIFELDGTWSQTSKIVASERAEFDLMGFSVGIDGNTAISGAYGEDDDAEGNNSLSFAGSAYLFERISVGVFENDFGDELIVYPNPTNGNVSIDLGEWVDKVNITMTDIYGRLVLTDHFSKSQLLNFKLDEPTGVYLLMIKSGAQKAVIRLVKE